jgi:hypothetical protein
LRATPVAGTGRNTPGASGPSASKKWWQFWK